MDAHGDALAQARRATAARDWPTAAAQFDVLESKLLTADDLAAHADAVWWLGRTEDALSVAGLTPKPQRIAGPEARVCVVQSRRHCSGSVELGTERVRHHLQTLHER